MDAENVTRLLKDRHIDVVISSPKRAIQTVQGIANTYDVSIQIEEDLRERLLSSESVADFNDAKGVGRLGFCTRRRRIE